MQGWMLQASVEHLDTVTGSIELVFSRTCGQVFKRKCLSSHCQYDFAVLLAFSEFNLRSVSKDQARSNDHSEENTHHQGGSSSKFALSPLGFT